MGNRPSTGYLVSNRALVHRINRTLVWSARRLMKSRGARAKQEYGDWYILDLGDRGIDGYAVIRDSIDLEALGRELGCLRRFERLGP